MEEWWKGGRKRTGVSCVNVKSGEKLMAVSPLRVSRARIPLLGGERGEGG